MALAFPSVGLAARAANYGYDWTGSPYYNVDLSDAAIRSAYYQQDAGYTTMTRDRGTGYNIWDKLYGIDPNHYSIINVISHGDWDNLAARPPVANYPEEMSCLYVSDGLWNAHSHTLGLGIEQCYDFAWVELLGSVPDTRWMVLQACDTASGTVNIASECCRMGVDTTVGFAEEIYIGGSGSNQKSIQYNFSAKYWKSLSEGAYNSKAMDDGADQVWQYHNHNDYGYDSHRAYGINGKI